MMIDVQKCRHEKMSAFVFENNPKKIAFLICRKCGIEIRNLSSAESRFLGARDLFRTINRVEDHKILCRHNLLTIGPLSQVFCMQCGGHVLSQRLPDDSLIIDRSFVPVSGHCAHLQIGVDVTSGKVECTKCSEVVGQTHKIGPDMLVIVGFSIVR